ncbi:MAG: hypothetical protein IJS15_06695 [Victivallales bacterium]|nr:hypothetical protein [Victivallales bacterium]
MKTHTHHTLLAICSLIASCCALAQEPPHPGKPPYMPRPPADSFANWGRGNEIMVIMQELKKDNPEEYARLTELRKTDTQAFFTEIRKRLPKPKNNMRTMFRMETECRNLALTIAECTDAEVKAKLEKMLKDKLKESFDFMIADSTERIEKMRKQLDALKANEESILEERFKHFTSPNFMKEMEGMPDRKPQQQKPFGRKPGMMPPEPPPEQPVPPAK